MHGDKTKQKLHALGTCDSDDDSNNNAIVVVQFVVDKFNSKSKIKIQSRKRERERNSERKVLSGGRGELVSDPLIMHSKITEVAPRNGNFPVSRRSSAMACYSFFFVSCSL